MGWRGLEVRAGAAMFEKSLTKGTGERVLVKFRLGRVGSRGKGKLPSISAAREEFQQQCSFDRHMGRERKRVLWKGGHLRLCKAWT